MSFLVRHISVFFMVGVEWQSWGIVNLVLNNFNVQGVLAEEEVEHVVVFLVQFCLIKVLVGKVGKWGLFGVRVGPNWVLSRETKWGLIFVRQFVVAFTCFVFCVKVGAGFFDGALVYGVDFSVGGRLG